MDFSNVDETNTRSLIEYLDFGSRFSRDDKLRTFAVQQLDAGMNVLDVGCGTGDDVRAIAEIVGALGHVVGIDPSGTMIEEANARGVPSNATFGVGSAYTLPHADGSFDAVRADRVMQHSASTSRARGPDAKQPGCCGAPALRTSILRRWSRPRCFRSPSSIF